MFWPTSRLTHAHLLTHAKLTHHVRSDTSKPPPVLKALSSVQPVKTMLDDSTNGNVPIGRSNPAPKLSPTTRLHTHGGHGHLLGNTSTVVLKDCVTEISSIKCSVTIAQASHAHSVATLLGCAHFVRFCMMQETERIVITAVDEVRGGVYSTTANLHASYVQVVGCTGTQS